MQPSDLSITCNGENVAKLISRGLTLVKERFWSTLPGNKPQLDGRVIPIRGRSSRVSEVLFSAKSANEAGNDIVIWVPRGAGKISRADGKGTFSNLRWGYTAHVLDGRLIAVQRVVFVDTAARELAVNEGLLLTVPEYQVSSWNGLAPATPRMYN